MKAHELVKALEEGKTLFKINDVDENAVSTIRLEQGLFPYVVSSGYGSGYGSTFERLNEIIIHPSLWNIREE